jgi:hypothetical protein
VIVLNHWRTFAALLSIVAVGVAVYVVADAAKERSDHNRAAIIRSCEILNLAIRESQAPARQAGAAVLIKEILRDASMRTIREFTEAQKLGGPLPEVNCQQAVDNPQYRLR